MGIALSPYLQTGLALHFIHQFHRGVSVAHMSVTTLMMNGAKHVVLSEMRALNQELHDFEDDE
jgi:hypothetical protein